MIPQKVKDHIEEYISQEVYVQIAIIKGKEKISTESAIDKYFNTCLLYTSPSPRDVEESRMPSSA